MGTVNACAADGTSVADGASHRSAGQSYLLASRRCVQGTGRGEWSNGGICRVLPPMTETLAAMEAHVAAMPKARADEAIWLLEHPPLYTAGTSAKAGGPGRPRPLSGLSGGARRAIHLSRARPAGGLLPCWT